MYKILIKIPFSRASQKSHKFSLFNAEKQAGKTLLTKNRQGYTKALHHLFQQK